MRRHAAPFQRAVAVAGLVLAAGVLVQLPADARPAPPWIWRFFVAWCVGVPYWHFVEFRFLLRPDADFATRERFAYLQSLSRTVWLGVALVLGVALLRH